MDDEYDTINDLDHLKEILRDKDGELEELENQLQQAAELGQGLVNEREELRENIEGKEGELEELKQELENENYEKIRLEDERKKLHENITARQAELEELKEELESEKEELEREKEVLEREKEERLNVPDDTKEKEMCDGVRETNETLKSELDTLKSEHSDLEEKYIGDTGRWEDNKTKLTKQITEQNEELDRLNSEIAQKSGLPDENEKLRKMLNDNKKHLIDKANELNECHSELDRFKVEDTGSSLADELGLTNQSTDNPSNEEMRNLKKENNRLRNEIERLANEGDESRKLVKELATI